MTSPFNRLTLRQWLLLAVFIPVAILFFRKRVFAMFPEFPTPMAIAEERSMLAKRRKQLAELESRLAAQESELANLRALAAPFWQIGDRSVGKQKGFIQTEVNKLIDRANIRGVDYQVMNPKRVEIPDKTHVYGVEVTVNITASMKEITRVLEQIERSPRRLSWGQCSITPYNLRDPNKVRLTGTVRARVLSPDAVAFLEPAVGEGG